MAVTARKKMVEVIPIKSFEVINGDGIKQKKKVCAYCRVSTSNEEQLESYANQVSHYTNYIQSKPEWDYVEVYADEGIIRNWHQE